MDSFCIKRPGVLLLLFFLSSAVVSAEVFFVLSALLLAIFVFKKPSLPVSFFYNISPLALIVIVGLISGVINNREGYDLIKDVWYFFKPIPYLLLGFYLYRFYGEDKFLYSVIWGGFFLSIYHLITVFNGSLDLNVSLDQFRAEVGRGYIITPVVLAISICGMYLASSSKYFISWCLVAFVCFGSVCLSYSRTSWLVLFLFLICIFGFVKGVRVGGQLLRRVVLLASCIVFFLSLNFFGGDFSSNLYDKFLNSFVEMDVKQYFNDRDINENWRGYESAQAMSQYFGGTINQLLLGMGFGSSVDLGLFISLDGYITDKAPIIHNGFIYVLYKVGLVGFVLYLLFLGVTLRYSYLVYSRANSIGLSVLLLPIAIYFFAASMAVTGIYNKGSIPLFLVIFGAVFSFSKNNGKVKK